MYDGDTVQVDIDLGLSIFVRSEPLRTSRIQVKKESVDLWESHD